jgi:hypothetical protein
MEGKALAQDFEKGSPHGAEKGACPWFSGTSSAAGKRFESGVQVAAFLTSPNGFDGLPHAIMPNNGLFDAGWRV